MKKPYIYFNAEELIKAVEETAKNRKENLMKKKLRKYKILVVKVLTLESETKWANDDLKLLGLEICSGPIKTFDMEGSEISTDFSNANIIEEQ